MKKIFIKSLGFENIIFLGLTRSEKKIIPDIKPDIKPGPGPVPGPVIPNYVLPETSSSKNNIKIKL